MYKNKRPAPEKGLTCTKKEPAFDYALRNTIHNPAPPPLSQLFPINIPNPQSTSPAPGHSKEKKTVKGKGKQANQVLLTKERSRSPITHGISVSRTPSPIALGINEKRDPSPIAGLPSSSSSTPRSHRLSRKEQLLPWEGKRRRDNSILNERFQSCRTS